ncbi:phospho-N-acetylmuramoyl-pentapeptide-transferase [Candidatus Kinetoplastibacterium desouzaii TCC079E]|uniref:Phospho-N-acetylmuramoyl-pentapeptide-transferase n=1 Tax=Candidatus Kinetoplastidibacterium desouzai TCC079E TaxID=1208919 RepID=M1L2Z3_9PROT|nr:phospho-N-acetylmuramoyl-pentapeptide-transferase [Candidatus Kinetoplastibacterium desouzaii]AGF47123.1 phospho-N-acetylmuramoyl-pentapeptide-transferase [Candidatus Kinetoplastibacterium desouzaii TCC079E]
MIIEILHLLGYFNFLENVCFRAMLTFFVSFILGILISPFIINKLRELRFKQAIRLYGPESHVYKEGTPTMGGVIILLTIVSNILLWSDLRNSFIWIVMSIMLSFGLIGFVDDYNKVVYNNPEGISAKLKILCQFLLAIFFSLIIAIILSNVDIHNVDSFYYHDFELLIPFLKDYSFHLGIISFIALSSFVIVGTSNAVNLTDGLDGLAIFPISMVAGALAIFAYIEGRVDFSSYLFVPYIEGSSELVVFCAAILGSGLSFLWFNSYPAQIFMGDVGSLSLGATLGSIAIIINQEITLIIMGGIFVLETISVILQVSWFRYTKRKYGEGKRIFKMTPLHHHFEVHGCKETHVVVRFWIVNIILILIALSSLIAK